MAVYNKISCQTFVVSLLTYPSFCKVLKAGVPRGMDTREIAEGFSVSPDVFQESSAANSHLISSPKAKAGLESVS